MGIEQRRRRRRASAAQSAAYKIETSNRHTKQGREREREQVKQCEREKDMHSVWEHKVSKVNKVYFYAQWGKSLQRN